MKVGDHIEIPVHYDMWMRGARTGVITSLRSGPYSQYFNVKMDNRRARRVKLWATDWEYAKVLESRA